MVENHGGTYEFAYAPTGTHPLAWLQGQTLSGAQLPLPGNAFAIYNGSGLAQYNHADWLGSARLFSTPARVASAAMSYAPFGEGYAGGIQDIQFTSFSSSYTVSGTESQGGTLDDFTFRRYSPVQGRWISPDPAGLAAVNPANPQTWNRYAYVANNPLSHTDRLGMNEDECDPDDDSCDDDGGGGGGPDPGDPLQPGPVGIPGFCDASCGGSGFGGGVDANGIPNNFGPGYLAQSTSGLSQILGGEQRYLSLITTGYDPAFGDPCAYLNDAGNKVESTDYSSDPGECTGHGGVWVPQNFTLRTDPFGNVFLQPPSMRQNFCFYTSPAGIGGVLAGVGLGMGSISWGGTLTTLGINGAEVTSFAVGAGTVGLYLAVGGAVLLVARGAFC
jgi:RHS repeat-associated protein